jgi:hypothetical protein
MPNITVSSSVDSMLRASDAPSIRDAIGSINYPYTTDFISGTEQTRNLTSITNSSGYTYNNNLTSIYVGSNVTTLGSSAFAYCANLTSANIPDSVTTLGGGAFDYCGSLTSVTIPDSVTSIGDVAFRRCGGLTSATIGNGVTTIGSYAFYYCTSLTSATIGNGVTSIGSYAFNYSTALSTINCLATTAPTLGTGVFSSIAATEIHVPVGATGYGSTYGGLTVVADL